MILQDRQEPHHLGRVRRWGPSEGGGLQYESDVIRFTCSEGDSGRCVETRLDRDKMAVGISIGRIFQKSREG